MKLPRALAAASLTLSGLVVVGGPAPLACAGEGPDATLVIDTGGSEAMYCVALDAQSVSGLHLIELAGEQHGISYSFGYGGQAVCMLAGVGSDEEECFGGGEPFWGYWRMGSSGWTWSGTGAGGARVDDGDVEGWSWGTGNDGSSHQQPPTTTHEAVCGAEDPPPEEEQPPKSGPKKGGGNKSHRGDGGDTTEGNGSSDTAKRNDPPGVSGSEDPTGGVTTSDDGTKDGRKNSGTRKPKQRGKGRDGNGRDGGDEVVSASRPTPTAMPIESPSSQPAATSSGGPPAAGIAGLLGTIVLGLAGAWFLKRRHAPVS